MGDRAVGQTDLLVLKLDFRLPRRVFLWVNPADNQPRIFPTATQRRSEGDFYLAVLHVSADVRSLASSHLPSVLTSAATLQP